MRCENRPDWGGLSPIVWERDDMKVILRRATEADAKHAASLLTELGYPSTEADARDRLVRSLHSATSYCLVAELAAEVVGLISAELVFYFPTGSTICRITSLVVSSQHRGHGLGRSCSRRRSTSRASIIARASSSPAPRARRCAPLLSAARVFPDVVSILPGILIAGISRRHSRVDDAGDGRACML